MEWPIIEPTSPRWLAATPEQRANATAVAAEILWLKTARVFGVFESTVRPCSTPPRPDTTYGHPSGARFITATILPVPLSAVLPCGCGTRSCTGTAEVSLPGPVHEIISVTIDGTTLPADAYHVRDQRWLIRRDGRAWPLHQRLEAADNEPGAFVVTYRYGVPVPLAGQIAAGDLAEALLTEGLAGCGIPAGVTNVSQQGVSMEIVSAAAMFDNGYLGVLSADRWIAAVNPGRQRHAAAVIDIESMARRIR